MKPTRQQAIRRLLLQHPDGLTRSQIGEKLNMQVGNVSTALKAMPDTYVDRFIPAPRGQYEKVWCAVYVPPDSPHPKDRIYKGGMGRAPRSSFVGGVSPWSRA
jgi:hypothetical protein